MRSPPTKRDLFVKEYIIDFNGTQAAVRAGYSEKTARSQAQRLLTKVDIQEAIQKAMEERNKRVEMDADVVLRSLVEIKEMSIKDILTDSGDLKPISGWPDVWCKTISGLDITTIGSGDTETILKKIKWPDKVKNLELIGKHVDIQAWRDRKEITGPGGGPIETTSQFVFVPVGSDYEPSKD